MNFTLASWKTTIAGIGAIGGGVATLCHALLQKPIETGPVATGLTAISSGIGLLFARDHNVSDEDAGQSPPQRQAQATADATIAAHAITPPPLVNGRQNAADK